MKLFLLTLWPGHYYYHELYLRHFLMLFSPFRSPQLKKVSSDSVPGWHLYPRISYLDSLNKFLILILDKWPIRLDNPLCNFCTKSLLFWIFGIKLQRLFLEERVNFRVSTHREVSLRCCDIKRRKLNKRTVNKYAWISKYKSFRTMKNFHKNNIIA